MWNLISQCEIADKRKSRTTTPKKSAKNNRKNNATKNALARESLVNEVVKLERNDVIAVVTVNSPPVNALSAAVRGGIFECMKAAIAAPEVKAIVLTCGGRTFIAGAAFTEFGKPPKTPGLHEVLTEMEKYTKPLIG